MSEEQQNEGQAAVAEAEAPAKVAEPIVDESYDESLLIKVKGRVKRPTRPDDTERNLQVQKLQDQIDKSSARMKEIKGILDSRASGGKVVPPEQQAIRDRIQQLRGEFDTVLVSTLFGR
jgi:chaperonin cofactor prefoldin